MKRIILLLIFSLFYTFVSYAQGKWEPEVSQRDSLSYNESQMLLEKLPNNLLTQRPQEAASIYYDAVFLSKSTRYDIFFAKKYGQFEDLDTIIRYYYFDEKVYKDESKNVLANISSLGNTDVPTSPPAWRVFWQNAPKPN